MNLTELTPYERALALGYRVISVRNFRGCVVHLDRDGHGACVTAPCFAQAMREALDEAEAHLERAYEVAS
jgi:hypothetical protein